MKFQVKVGKPFSGEFTVEVEEQAQGWFAHWKSLAVVAVFLLIVSSGVYAVTSDDPKLFTGLLNTIVEVVKAQH